MTRKEIRMIAEQLAEIILEQERMKDRMITASMAAEITGLSVKTLYNCKAKIGYRKMGRLLMFSERDVKAYAAGKLKG